MLIVWLYGFSELEGEEKMVLELNIQTAVEKIEGLGVNRDRVMVVNIPVHQLSLLITIGGLIRGWSPILRDKLAKVVISEAQKVFPKEVIHCFVRPYDSKLTYRTSKGQGDTITHSLDPEGLARCRFSAKKEDTWPNNHRGTTIAEDVTCPDCLATRP